MVVRQGFDAVGAFGLFINYIILYGPYFGMCIRVDEHFGAWLKSQTSRDLQSETTSEALG